MSNKPISAHCDAGCKKEFTITKFRTKKVKSGIEKTYFRCTHCKHEYVSYYASAETIQLQKDIRKLYVRMRTANFAHEGIGLFRQEAELKAMIKQSMAEVRAIAEG